MIIDNENKKIYVSDEVLGFTSKVATIAEPEKRENPDALKEKTKPETLKKISQQFWTEKDIDYLQDYIYGYNHGKFQSNDRNIKSILTIVVQGIQDFIKEKYSKSNIHNNDLALYFTLLDNITLLITKQVEKDIPNTDINSILANLHGFIESIISSKKD